MKKNDQSNTRRPLRPADVLVCFAVKEEAKFFVPSRAEVLVTGIGRKNAGESIREAINVVRPSLVLTCGFAGGLNPELPTGAIVFDEDLDAGLSDALLGLGAIPVKFH